MLGVLGDGKSSGPGKDRVEAMTFSGCIASTLDANTWFNAPSAQFNLLRRLDKENGLITCPTLLNIPVSRGEWHPRDSNGPSHLFASYTIGHRYLRLVTGIVFARGDLVHLIFASVRPK